MRCLPLVLAFLLACSAAHAELKKQTIEYKDGDTALEGYLVYDQALDLAKTRVPGVVVVHDWMGLGDYAKMRAEQLAAMGYIVFAADIYGKGVRPQNTDEASKQAGYYKEHRDILRSRAQAALDLLSAQPNVDTARLSAIGYCFGGTTVLEMARASMGLAGVVSFHGGLSTPMPAGQGSVKPKVLVLHGADDPYVPPAEVADFQKEMNLAGADWQMVYYSGAVHSFTHKGAGNDNSKGAAYNENADHRSWEAMKVFFDELFKK